MSRRDRYDPSEYAQRKAMQRDRAERIRASRSGGGGGGSGSSGAAGGGGSSGGWAEPDARGDSRGDDLLSRLEALKSQLSTPQHADTRPAPDEEPTGRARSDAERARRREAEAALQRERHKHITMQDEIAGLREQVTALQNTSRPPAPAPAPERRFAASSSSSSSSGRGRGRSDAAESAEQKREMDEALERANRLSEERVARQQEREAAEEAERLAREAEDEAWTHVRFRPVPARPRGRF